MKRFTFAALLSVFVFAAVIGFSSRATEAQDDMMLHTCDSTLIALLYIAEYHYGFHSMEMDLATFEKGQFAPLFDAMMDMMDMMEEGDMMATEEAMMEETMTEEPMTEAMVMLMAGNVADEDPACTALRAELDAFILTALKDEMMTESS